MQLDNSDGDDLLLGDGSEQRVPRDLVEPAAVYRLAFHPNAPILCTGLMNGCVNVHEWRRNETRAIASLPTHRGAVCSMEFTRSGSHLATVSSDRHIKVLDCASQAHVIDIRRKNSPHKFPLSILSVCTSTELAVGDDDGMVSFWDMRMQKPVTTFLEHADQVTGMIYFEGNHQLVTSSTDTTVGCFDMRMRKVAGFSEKRKDELNCITFLPATNSVIAGTDAGMLPIWKYGAWKRPYDVHSKHPRECEALLTYNDNMFFSGAYDGTVRLIQHHPVRRVLTNFGSSRRNFNTVSGISVSHDRTLLAAATTGSTVFFYDIEFLGDESELDKLRDRAERKHMETIRKASAEDRVPDSDSDSWSADSSDACDDSEDDAPAATGRPMPRDEGLDRTTKRERMAASRWLKTAQKERINFTSDTRKKRVKSFWTGLLED